MSETVTSPWWRGPRGLVVVVVALVAVVAVVVILVRGGSSDDADPAASPGATPSSSASPTASAAPSSSAPTSVAPSAAPSSEPSSTSAPSGATDAAPPLPGSKPAVDLDEPARVETDVVARVVRVTRIQGEARGVGEVAGPALKVDLRIVNRSGKAVSVADAVANLDFGATYAPASPLLDDKRNKPFAGSVAAGARATASYVFSVGSTRRVPVRVTFSSSGTSDTVVFEGRA